MQKVLVDKEIRVLLFQANKIDLLCEKRLFFFPRGVFDEILNLIESVSEGFLSYLSWFFFTCF